MSNSTSPFYDTNRVIAIILGGGAGTRLFPLTKERSKPAVPIGGKYRLVDVPISLAINSNIKRIFLLTQYLSSSLHRHVQQSYRFEDYQPRGFVEICAAQQTAQSLSWYQGTADAVRQNLMHFNNHDHDLVLILSGDQLYRMDLRYILAQHVDNQADVTVATIPVNRDAVPGFGIMQIDHESRITRFVEKPKDPSVIDTLRIPNSHEDLYLASMGIYVFNRRVLKESLSDLDQQDFGKGIIPALIQNKRVFSYVYRGYWEDIGTIKAFFDCNLGLTDPSPLFSFFDPTFPIYTRSRHLPAPIIQESKLVRTMISDGCQIANSEITRAVLGLRSKVGSGARISNSIIMGADYFETPDQLNMNEKMNRPDVGIGRNTVIEGAIIDKNARIGNNVVINPQGKPENVDASNYYIREGIVIVPKGSVIPDGTVV